MKKIRFNGYPYIKYNWKKQSPSSVLNNSMEFYKWINTRRSVRDISKKNVDKKVIESLILSAGTAPSGAHKQPWTFCAVSNPKLKSEIRSAAEQEEIENYKTRMSERWKRDLLPLGTHQKKPFLETAPWLIIVFRRIYETDEDGSRHNNYYVNESVGIACGFLISAIHKAGLVTLTHTPSPMNFLSKILNRPDNERPFLICPVGYPEDDTYIPDLNRKDINEIAEFYE